MEKIEFKNCYKIISDNGDITYHCKKCNREFDLPRQVNMHYKNCDGSGIIKSKEYKSCNEVIKDDGSIVYSCKGCSREFNTPQSAANHAMWCIDYIGEDRYNELCKTNAGINNPMYGRNRTGNLNPNFGKKVREFSKIKYKETCIQRYGFENTSQVPEFKDKRMNTILEKYGVPYACLTKACRMSILPNSSKEFAKIFNSFGSSVDYEFVIEDRSYDLIVNDSILIEIDDTYSHNSTKPPYYRDKVCDSRYHLFKTELANKNGYHCIHIFDWDDPDKIAGIFGLNKKRIYARNCEVKLINDYSIVKEFLNNNHLQGSLRYDKSMVSIGLFHESRLISLMLFGKPRYNKNCQWELLRLCTDLNYEVVGGNNKVFKYFINNYNPESIISYCDRSKFNGKVYQKLGFKLKNITGPTPHWFNGQKHFTDALLRQRGADQLIKTNYGKGTNNEEIMIDHGYMKVFDCGQDVYKFIAKFE